MSEKEDFYKYFGLSNASKGFKQKQEITQLYTVPKEDIPSPHFYNYVANDTQQTDILYLPKDKGFLYCLVVVDIATNKTDAEPVKNLDAEVVPMYHRFLYIPSILFYNKLYP